MLLIIIHKNDTIYININYTPIFNFFYNHNLGTPGPVGLEGELGEKGEKGDAGFMGTYTLFIKTIIHLSK